MAIEGRASRELGTTLDLAKFFASAGINERVYRILGIPRERWWRGSNGDGLRIALIAIGRGRVDQQKRRDLGGSGRRTATKPWGRLAVEQADAS